MTPRKLALLLAFVTSAVVLPSVHAQGYAPAPAPGYAPGPPPQAAPAPARDGFMIGFSGGFGSMKLDCDNCDSDSQSGFSFDFSIGGFINPNMAIMYDASGVMHSESEGDQSVILTNSLNTVALQSWVAPKFWLKGGIGFARLFLSGDNVPDDASVSGWGVTAAAGYDVVQSGNFALDLSLRLSNAFYDDDGVDFQMSNASLHLGVHWY